MSHFHAVVWIDHQRATVWQFTSTEQTSTVIHAHDQHQRVHSRKSMHGGHKSPADLHYFDEVGHALEGVHEILVIGPAQTKQEFAAICAASIRNWGAPSSPSRMPTIPPTLKCWPMRDAISPRSTGCSRRARKR